MTNRELRRWNRAARLAFVAMGKTPAHPGRGNKRAWAADEDPLAWVCLTEAIYDIGTEPTPAPRHTA